MWIEFWNFFARFFEVFLVFSYFRLYFILNHCGFAFKSSVITYVALLKQAQSDAYKRGGDESFNHFIRAACSALPWKAVTNSEDSGETF